MSMEEKIDRLRRVGFIGTAGVRKGVK